MAAVVASSSNTSTPPPFDILSSPPPAPCTLLSSPSTLFQSPAKTARSLPVSRSGSFSTCHYTRPLFACGSASTTPVGSPPTSSTFFKRSSRSATGSPCSSIRPALPTEAHSHLHSASLSQADLHSILVAAVSAHVSQANTASTTPLSSPSPQESMRSLSHSQATARSSNAVASPGQHLRRSSRPSSALYSSKSIGELQTDDMSDGTLAAGASRTGSHAALSDKENLHSTHATSSAKPPSRNPSSSSLLHQPFKHQHLQYQGSTSSPTTPLSTSPVTSPSSASKHTRRRSSVAYPYTPSSRSSRPNSLVEETSLPSSSSSSLLSGHRSGYAPHTSVEEAVFVNDEDVEDADNEGPAKFQRKARTSSASHTSRTMSSHPSDSSKAAHSHSAVSTTPTKSPRTTSSVAIPALADGSPTHNKDRRSRRSSASSARARSRRGSTSANTASASTSPNTTPRTTRVGSISFKDALDMHSSSHATSSSLSNRSDTTLHPADFSFSPFGLSDHDTEADAVTGLDMTPVGPSLSSEIMSPCVSSERASNILQFSIIKIKDYAFPPDDPRFIGEAAPPTPIDIPDEESDSRYHSWISPNSLNGQLANGPNDRQCDPSPSLSLMSSSSSSSLSSSFTPPPFGSFGQGHHYHYSGSGNARYDASSASRRDAHGQLRLPPGGSWSTWDQSNLESAPAQEDDSNAHTPTSTTSSGNNNGSGSSSGRMWNFITDNSGIVPTTLLDSALSIEDFDDEFDEDDDFEARSYTHDLTRDNDIDEDESTPSQQQLLSQMTPEERANEESFANLPAGTGVYRVQYTFTAEAPQEMEVQEGDHVRVWQQLCDGWVLGAKVIRKESSSSTHSDRIEYAEPCSGLVPQSYLVFSHTVILAQGDEENNDGQERTICYTTHPVGEAS